MADIGHEKTDDIIDELEKKIRKEYEQANKEVQQKVDKYFARFKVKDAKKQAEVLAGTLSQKDYEEWRYGQMCVGERWKDLKDQLAKDYVNVNNIARSTAEGYAPEVYALNHNFAAYQVQHDAKMDISWTLYNREAVEYLMRDDPQLLPFLGTHSPTAEKLRERMDLLWNRQHINSAITQGILQGEPIPRIAKRLERVTNMNTAAAVRNARTMMTSAENKGRQDAYNRLKEKGIDLQEVWMATLDGRTRHSHRALHGTYKDPKSGEYANGLRYPGDPMGEPEEIYNCRCCEIAEVEGVKVGAPNYSPKMENMSFDEWLKGGSGHPTWVEEAVPPIQMRRYLNFTDYMSTLDGKDLRTFQDILYQDAFKSGNYDINSYWQDYIFGREQNERLNEFINRGEDQNTQQVINYDKLFMNVKGLPDDFKQKMGQILSESKHESAKALYAKYADQLVCKDPNLKGGAYFSSGLGVFMNIADVADGDSIHTPYQTAFHEFGHMMDWLMNNRNNWKYASTLEYEGVTLMDCLKEDFKELKQTLGVTRREDVIPILRRERLSKLTTGNVSDILEKFTGKSYPLGVGHGVTYHKREGATEKEFWAEVLDSSVANQEAYEYMERIFPRGVNWVWKVIENEIGI